MTISKLNQNRLLISEFLKLGSESYMYEYTLSFVNDSNGWRVMLSKHADCSSFYHLYTARGRYRTFATLDAAYEAVKSCLNNVHIQFL